MCLKKKNIKASKNRDDYINPIHFTNIFCEEDKGYPLYEWVKEVGKPVLEKIGGRPSSLIASKIGINVDDSWRRNNNPNSVNMIMMRITRVQARGMMLGIMKVVVALVEEMARREMTGLVMREIMEAMTRVMVVRMIGMSWQENELETP